MLWTQPQKGAALLTVALALSSVAFVGAQADVFVMQNQGNTIVPLEETQISMDSEIVEVKPEEKSGELEARCTFLMTSHARGPVRRTVAFPIVHPTYGNHMKKHFTVTVDGRSQPAVLKMTNSRKDWMTEFYYRPDHERHQYPGAMQWPVTWDPKQTRRIVCSYKVGSLEPVSGLVRGRRFRYVVRTGNYWRGSIGNATITVRFRDDPRLYVDSGNPDSVVSKVTFPGQANWVSAEEVRWTFSDWEPKEDIVVETFRWVVFQRGYTAISFFPQTMSPVNEPTRRHS